MKRCRNCGKLKPLNEYHKKHDNADGHTNICSACENEIHKQYRRRGNAKNIYRSSGGPYQVVYDPCDTFTNDSSFRRAEIAEMLDNEYLAIGTRFRRGVTEYEISEKFTLQEIIA